MGFKQGSIIGPLLIWALNEGEGAKASGGGGGLVGAEPQYRFTDFAEPTTTEAQNYR